MKVDRQTPARRFTVKDVEISHVADIELATDELITFKTETGAEYDVARKDWGFYATPSINGRLRDNGFRTALVSNPEGRHYVLLVEQTKMPSFDAYCEQQTITVLKWLDDEPV